MTRVARNKSRCFLLVVLGSWWTGPAIAGPALSLYGAGPERWVFSQESLRSDEDRVRTKGYDVNSIEDLSRATKDKAPAVREGALYLLARKAKGQSIPVLKQACSDPWPGVRCAAARLMGVLGDRSGLDRMRKDWAELMREGQKDDVSAEDFREREKRGEPTSLGSASGRLYYALQVAQVLAEFGDSSGYEVAARTAVQDKVAVNRGLSMMVLAELGRLDKATLEARGCDPEAVLLVVAESETASHSLEVLYGCVTGRMRPESKVRILEKLERSPHLSDQRRRTVTGALQDVRRQLEKDKQATGQKKE